MSNPGQERRKYERVKLLRPLPGRAGTSRVFIIEAGISGFSIAHQGTLPRPGQKFALEFDWEGRLLKFECEVVHNDLQKLAKSSIEKSVYNAGVHVVAASGNSAVLLRKIVTEHVERALDEQKANARGIPAKAAHAFQTGGKSAEYVRCELVNGTWRRTTTTRPEQPPNGFTISSAEEKEQVDMLCESFASGDESARQMIRMMAEATIQTDGVPTRKYTP